MGVDFYSCHYCDETFPDCGDYFSCDCGHHYCDYTCGDGKSGDDDDTRTCRICRLDYIQDHTLVNFLLSKASLTREEAEQLYRNEFIEHSTPTA